MPHRKIAAGGLDELGFRLLSAGLELRHLAVLGELHEKLRAGIEKFLHFGIGRLRLGLFQIARIRELHQKRGDLAGDPVVPGVLVEIGLHRGRIVLHILQVSVSAENCRFHVVLDVVAAVERLKLAVRDHPVIAELVLQLRRQENAAKRLDEQLITAAGTDQIFLELLVTRRAVLSVFLENREFLHEIDHLRIADGQSLPPRRDLQTIALERLGVIHIPAHAHSGPRQNIVFAPDLFEIPEGDLLSERRTHRHAAARTEAVTAELAGRQEPHERNDDHNRKSAEQPAAVLVKHGVELFDNHLRGHPSLGLK